MLDKEYEHYRDNSESFLKEYPDKFIVIKGTEVIGVYSSREEALKETIKEHKLGTFLIQEVSKDDKTVQRFLSRVYV